MWKLQNKVKQKKFEKNEIKFLELYQQLIGIEIKLKTKLRSCKLKVVDYPPENPARGKLENGSTMKLYNVTFLPETPHIDTNQQGARAEG